MSYTQKKYPPDKATGKCFHNSVQVNLYSSFPVVVDNYEVLLSIGQGQNLKLTVVDTAGQEDFVNIRKLSYGGTHSKGTLLHGILRVYSPFYLTY